jgi:transposase
VDLLLGGGGFQLPWYAPELNPVEPLWAHAKKRLAHRAIEDDHEDQ